MRIKTLARQGVPKTEIARRCGVSRQTVYNHLNRDSSSPKPRKRRPSKLDPYKEYLRSRLEEYDLPATVLYREIRAMGYEGKLTILRDFVRPLKKELTRRVVERFETRPGHQAQIDWGQCGKITETVTSALRTFTNAPITPVRPSMDLPFELDYDTPDTLGNDRLAAATAGWVQYGRDAAKSVLVVDAGTAVNYEVIHRDGIYQGGTIDAGPVLVRQALRAGTAQLPEVPLTLPDTPVGSSTQTALQSGIMWGLLDSVRGMRTRLAQTLPDTPRLILTGGWSALLTDHLDEAHHAPHLVLRGVRLLTVRNG